MIKEKTVILRLKIKKLPPPPDKIEIYDLEFDNAKKAEECSTKIKITLFSEANMVELGPDKHGKSKLVLRTSIEELECEFIEDPAIEDAIDVIKELRDKINKVVEEHHHYHYEPYIWPY